MTDRNRVTPESHPDLERAPFPCIACGRELCNVFSTKRAPNQPYDACAFTSQGHYGCTIFDEMDGAKIEINVCDDCLIEARARGHVGYWPGHPRRQMRVWADE